MARPQISNNLFCLESAYLQSILVFIYKAFYKY